mmetsp:Transcript_6077/g.11519  ORF Transcript_6077/g.11519 Transcript_6077/m.11519 type:complete len:204 (+) Transcript_6077:1431-2042(+)
MSWTSSMHSHMLLHHVVWIHSKTVLILLLHSQPRFPFLPPCPYPLNFEQVHPWLQPLPLAPLSILLVPIDSTSHLVPPTNLPPVLLPQKHSPTLLPLVSKTPHDFATRPWQIYILPTQVMLHVPPASPIPQLRHSPLHHIQHLQWVSTDITQSPPHLLPHLLYSLPPVPYSQQPGPYFLFVLLLLLQQLLPTIQLLPVSPDSL